MPSGDAQRAWLPEMLSELEVFWTKDFNWESLIDFCAQMTVFRAELRLSKGIQDPIFYCPNCKEYHVAGPLDVSPRSAFFAALKLGLMTQDQMKTLDRAWTKYRKQFDLDALGKPKSSQTPQAHP